MTQWEMGYTCEDCDEHDGTFCRNRNSDHYGHAVMPMHPVCDHLVKIEEYVHHVNCASHDGGACNCRNE